MTVYNSFSYKHRSKIWSAFRVVLISMFFLGSALTTYSFARVLRSVDSALEKMLPEVDTITKEIKTLSDEQKKAIKKSARVKFDPEFDKEFVFHVGTSGGDIVGYAVEGKGRGKHGPIHYIVALSVDGKVTSVAVLEYREKRGKAVAYNKFLDQFIGKSVDDRVRLKRDIDGVSGATISSKAMTVGVKKIIHVFDALYGK